MPALPVRGGTPLLRGRCNFVLDRYLLTNFKLHTPPIHKTQLDQAEEFVPAAAGPIAAGLRRACTWDV